MPDPADTDPSCVCDSPASHPDPEQSTIAEDWPVQAFAPDGTTLLDPKETTVQDASVLPELPDTQADQALSRSFRHRGWQGRRLRTERSLKASGFPLARIQRFEDCGSVAFVLRNADGSDQYRIASNRCHDRFCVPCANEKSRIVASNLLASLPRSNLRFLTFTQKGTELPLADRLAKLYADFRRLRALLRKGDKITGGIAFLEITRNQATRQWHPHLHVIAAGKFIPQAWLRDRWLEITGDSFIVDVRLIRDKEEAARYITKYATKTLSPKVWSDHDSLCEAMQALAGRRTFNVFGDWTGLHLSRPPADNVEWVYCATLPDLLRRHFSGELLASSILSKLVNRSTDDPLPADLSAVP